VASPELRGFSAMPHKKSDRPDSPFTWRRERFLRGAMRNQAFCAGVGLLSALFMDNPHLANF
jgi:hypothetical protein